MSERALAGRIFDISRGCVHDGPGLRTVVFLKGCDFGCPWCHNPEGQSARPAIAFDAARCIGCDSCREACPRHKARDPDWRRGCTGCGACAEVCPAGARQLVGREVEVEALVEELLVDREFFAGTGGGVTFSGGEPLRQSELVFACAAALRQRGCHVAVETSGLWPPALLDRLVAEVDLVIADVKHIDPDKLRRATGRDLAVVVANLDRLLASPVALELRMTVVPGFNDTAPDLDQIAAWLTARRPVPLSLQGFHRMAAAKAERHGLTYRMAAVASLPAESLAAAAAHLRGRGVAIAD